MIDREGGGRSFVGHRRLLVSKLTPRLTSFAALYVLPEDEERCVATRVLKSVRRQLQ
jgi:hypothetical protein